MSRAYRIAVKESLSRVIKGEDKVSTDLEILEVLPAGEMCDLLAGALQEKGFEKQEDGTLVKKFEDVIITVDPTKGTVTISTESSQEVTLETEEVGSAYDDAGPAGSSVRKQLKERAQEKLEKQVSEKEAALQKKTTDKLEAKLQDVRVELDQVVNRVTAEALKRKASRIGQIKEISENVAAGSLTIKVEV